MRQRVGHRFQNGLVQLHLRAGQVQFDVLAQLLGQVADHAGEAAEEIADRLHPRPQDDPLQLAGDSVEALDDRSKAGVGGVRRSQRLVADQHQLAGQRHEPIEQADRDANAVGGVGGAMRGRRRAGSVSDRRDRRGGAGAGAFTVDSRRTISASGRSRVRANSSGGRVAATTA